MQNTDEKLRFTQKLVHFLIQLEEELFSVKEEEEKEYQEEEYYAQR